ncbi:fructosamine kinase family protein [Kocuria sp. HSID16901]|uniref:fructosamine kinase family protein n=1 Tax=Kocuria sp. HSID16901 TaxID=2419505 RepID=UPI00065F9A77|nr:fructosamine kinase family protein [Kocuria sp. HSID16901]RUQ21796.1 fructosamine kinase [Kocuria sp. HSID16901]
METFTKHTTGRAADWEKAGLDWLAEAEEDGGARVCRVVDVVEDGLQLEMIHEASPSTSAARAFGQGLALTHDAGAAAFGAGPTGWEGDGYQGPAGQQLPLPLGEFDSWGAMFARLRLAPLVRETSGFSGKDRALFDTLCDRLHDGAFDDDDAPARLHGDLWAGNVLWADDQAVLIDPTPYGGHREDDLAALAMFGAPHLGDIVKGYEEVHRLESGWQERVDLHQLHLILLHAALFGGGYLRRATDAARRYV